MLLSASAALSDVLLTSFEFPLTSNLVIALSMSDTFELVWYSAEAYNNRDAMLTNIEG
jgi:hypothetical protein